MADRAALARVVDPAVPARSPTSQNTVLAAILTFSDRVLYPSYEQVPRLCGLSALDDQVLAGV